MAKINIDFSEVTEGFSLPAEGEHICKVKAISVEDGNKGKYLKWTLVIGLGPDKGKQVFHNTSFSPNALFNLRNTIMACGIDVPKSAFQVNTDLYIGKILGIVLEHRDYKDKEGKDKKSTSVSELFRVVKTDKGYVRAEQTVADSLDDSSKVPDLDEDPDEIDI